MPKGKHARPTKSQSQRKNQILSNLQNTARLKLNPESKIQSRIKVQPSLATLFRTNNNEGYFISKSDLVYTSDTTMNNASFQDAIEQCEKEKLLIQLTDSKVIKALFPHRSPDGTRLSRATPILALTTKGQKLARGIALCQSPYSTIQDVLESLAAEEENSEIIKMIEELCKKWKRPSPFLGIIKT